MIIRKATLKDLDQLAHLFDGYRVFYCKDSALQAGSDFLRERFTNQDSEIFICEDGSDLLGFTQLYPLFSSTRMKRLWLLNDLYVHPDHRGKGISKQLIEAAKKLAQNTDACGVMLETEVTNDIGNKLYPSTGFTKNNGSNFYEWTCD